MDQLQLFGNLAATVMQYCMEEEEERKEFALLAASDLWLDQMTANLQSLLFEAAAYWVDYMTEAEAFENGLVRDNNTPMLTIIGPTHVQCSCFII